MKTHCDHEKFHATVDVTRAIDNFDKKVTVGYMADVRVVCVECGTNFAFYGMDRGMSGAKPMMSFDGLEARLPIRPCNFAQSQ